MPKVWRKVFPFSTSSAVFCWLTQRYQTQPTVNVMMIAMMISRMILKVYMRMY